MDDLWAALGLVLVLEGAAYALFPRQMVRMIQQLPQVPPSVLRVMGIAAVAMGWLVVWVVRRS
ncbi:MAG TPA: DUF2065 domain-containing protein [Mariprofundaceae bacterium]|nr:DUF2065 domain-containing protein [Mariprofundaceae bacterium]